jgi:uroporphyrinogen decarboxylase
MGSKMNKKELVRLALLSQPVPRPPASFWFHFPQDEFYGDASVQAHLRFYRETNVDFVKLQNEHKYTVESPLRTAADWADVRKASASVPFQRDLIEELKRVLDAIGDEVFVIVTMHGVFASAFHATRAPEESFSHGNPVVAHLREKPEAVSSALDAISDSIAEFSLACLDAGADGIYYAALGGEEYRFTEEEFLTYIKPYDLKVMNAIMPHAEFNVLHVCKDRVRLPLYADYPGHVVNWSVHEQNLDIHAGRALFKRPILGGMDYRGVMVDGTHDEIRTAVQRVMDDVGTTGLLLGADCTLPSNTPTSNIRAAVEATQGA